MAVRFILHAIVALEPSTVEGYGSLWAPTGTPQGVIAKINEAVVQALADSAVRQRIADAGQEVVPVDRQSPAALLLTKRLRLRNGGRL